jgi:hypothetical protein
MVPAVPVTGRRGVTHEMWFESWLGSQISKPQAGVELDLAGHSWSYRIGARAEAKAAWRTPPP